MLYLFVFAEKQLTSVNLGTLLSILGNHAFIAEQLGHQLGLNAGLVETFRQQNMGNLIRFLTDVLKAWLQRLNPPATLQALTSAIRTLPGGQAHQTLAQELEMKYNG